MLTWQDIVARSEKGNVAPPSRVEKTEQEWQAQLSDEAFRVTRQKGTERAFSSGMCTLFEPAVMAVHVAVHCCLMEEKNLIQERAGLLLLSLLKIVRSRIIKIPATV